MTTQEPVVTLYEVVPRGAHHVGFEWETRSGPVAGYLTLRSARDGHHFEAAIRWEQLRAVHAAITDRLAAYSASHETGELPRITEGASPPGVEPHQATP